MKWLNIGLENSDYEELVKIKKKYGFISWRELILTLKGDKHVKKR